MGKSFFIGTDEELYVGTQNFSTRISAAPEDYNLTSGLATAYATLNTSWCAAYLAAKEKGTRSKEQVQLKNDLRSQIRALTSQYAKTIDGFASVTDDMKIALGLSVRKTPSPRPAPGTPSDFKAIFLGDGSVQIGWKCHNPKGAQGTMYQVYRQDGATGEFNYVGGTGKKKFPDGTIPNGVSQVTYRIQAVRSTAVGAWGEFNVKFGMSGSGAMTATVTEAKPVKLAA